MKLLPMRVVDASGLDCETYGDDRGAKDGEECSNDDADSFH